LKPLPETAKHFDTQRRMRTRVFPWMIALLFAACVIAAAGCSDKETPPATTGSAVGGASLQKPTAAQEAAKQRAIEQGPAITSAIQDMNGKK
jgi:hypothetical protein